MRILFLIISIILGSLCCGKSADQKTIEDAAIVLETNSPICAVFIDYRQEKTSPMCNVQLASNFKNNRVWGLKLPAEMLFAVDLFDAKGQMVEKTAYGWKFGQPLFQREINDWFHQIRKGRGGWTGWFWVTDPESVGKFSILEAFKIRQAGKYTLHLRLRLIQTALVDSLGTIKRKSVYDGQYFRADKSGQVAFQITWLPEVTTEIQIRSGDIPPANLLPNVETNSPVK